MPDPMTSTYDRVEVITSVQRRRRWTTEEKRRIVEETSLPGNTVSLVARRHGLIAPRSTAQPALHLAAADDPRCFDRCRGR